MKLGNRPRCPKGYVRTYPGSDTCKPKGAKVRPMGREEYELPEWRKKCDPGYHKIPRTRRCKKKPPKPVLAAVVARPVVNPAARGVKDAARARQKRMRDREYFMIATGGNA